MKYFSYFFYFFTAILIVSCNSIKKPKQESKIIECPKTFFSSENRTYISTEDQSINLDNLSFRADLNNFDYIKECQNFKSLTIYPLDILVIIKPLIITNNKIDLPIYATLLDKDDNLIETQYFSISTNINYNEETNTYHETDFSYTLEIITKKKSAKYIIVGFMLDSEKLKVLN